jgi:hypothetical protein
MTGAEVQKLYSIEENGDDFFVLEKKIIGYTGPWLLLVESVDENGVYKFGSFQSGPIKDVGENQGDAKGFMFTL